MVATKATKPVSKKPTESKTEESLSAAVVGVDGKSKGRIQLPKELFGVKINKQLLAQAVRVYLANQRVGHAATKTRGQVEGSTRKIYRQKGTGRARHGAIRAPIFVGGGIVFGPHPRDYHLDMPKKMKRAALAAALTSRLSDVIIVDGLSDLPPKTKEMVKALLAIGATGKTLVVTGDGAQNVQRAVRNIENVNVMPSRNLFAYAVLNAHKLVFMKNTVSKL